jgi:ribose transport system ATP-binding protein
MKDVNTSSENQELTPIVELDDIQKYFGESCAVNNVHFVIREREIVGLIGPNGAGKSTLSKIITGDVPPTDGTIKIDGADVSFHNYSKSLVRSTGIVCVYQELSLCNNLSVYENFCVTHYDHPEFTGLNWRKTAKAYVQSVLDDIFPENGIDVSATVESHLFSQRQMIDIARAVSMNGLRLLILDEPTSSLSFSRIAQMHEVIRALKERDVSIIYVTHKLEEIKQVCDRITIMRNGAVTHEVDASTVTTLDLIAHLGGNEESTVHTVHKTTAGQTVLAISNLSTSALKNISFEGRQGEIIGLSGLSESGQEQLLYEIFRAGTSGKHKQSMQVPAKISFISGDRQAKGIFPYWSIADNIIISSLDSLCKYGIINEDKANSLALYWYQKLKFRAAGHKAIITSLSGGNQQKALIARGLSSDVEVILLDDPTRGVDIETKQEIYHLLQEAKASGKTIVWYSTEDEEMLQCDRVLIMHAGSVARELEGGKTSVKEIISGYFKEDAMESPAQARLDTAVRKTFAFRREMIPFIILFVILALNMAFNPRIMSYYGIRLVFSTALPLVFVGIAQMLVVQLGDIDLGAGAGAGLINVFAATVMFSSMPAGVFLCCAFICAYAGMGVLIYVRKLPALVTTLGASFIWIGIGLVIQPKPGGAAPAWIKSIYSFHFPFIPTPLMLGLVFTGIVFLIMKRSKYGVILRGVGDNPTALMHAGWSCLAARVVTYALAAFFLVLAGLYFTGISNGSDINAMPPYTMYSLAAIVLGGSVFTGGISQPFGVLAAAFAIILISTLLVFAGAGTDQRHAIVGTILILSFLPSLLVKGKRLA